MLQELKQAFVDLLRPAEAVAVPEPGLGKTQAAIRVEGIDAQPASANDATDNASLAGGPAIEIAVPRVPPAEPVQELDFALRGWHLDVSALPNQLIPAAQLLDQHGFGIDTITGVDWIAADEMEVVYDFYHPSSMLRVAVRCRVPRTAPEVPTLSEVFPGANWHERETHDFFGIRFSGHPDLSPFLLPEDADYHPLRKDFKA